MAGLPHATVPDRASTLNFNELELGIVKRLKTAPRKAVPGQMYFNTTSSRLYVYKNGAWAEVEAGTGSDANYVHDQATPAATWTINHNLGKRPSVTIVDSAGTVQITQIDYNSDNQCEATFTSAFSGKAYVN